MLRGARRGGRAILIALSLLIVGALGATALVRTISGPSKNTTLVGVMRTSATPSGSAQTSAGTSATGVFYIAGDVHGFYPGRARRLQLTVSNPQTFDIDVTRITVRIRNSNHPGCTSFWLRADEFNGSLLVPAQGSATLKIRMGLRRKAPDACQGATWPLTYSGTAVMA